MITSVTTNRSISEWISMMQTSVASQSSSNAEAIAMEAERCKGLQAALQRLDMRANQLGLPVDAARIREAREREQSLVALFAADPVSVAGNYADAQALASYLEQNGIEVEARLHYPVLVRSIIDGKSSERLFWMSSTERMRLDQLPLSQSAELPGCPTRKEVGKNGEIRFYCCLDAFATLRLPGTSVPELCERLASELQTTNAELRTMSSSFARAAAKKECDLDALRSLLRALSRKLEKCVEEMREDAQIAPKEFQQWQKDIRKRQDERTQERKHAIERLNLQRDASRASR